MRQSRPTNRHFNIYHDHKKCDAVHLDKLDGLVHEEC